MQTKLTKEKLLRKLLEDLFTFSHFLPVFENKVEKKTKSSIVDSGTMITMVLYLNFTHDKNHSACHKHRYSLPIHYALEKYISQS